MCCVLLGMLQCLPLRPRRGAAVGATRGAASLSTRAAYGMLLGMLHCMPLRPRWGATEGATQGAASLRTRTGYRVLLGATHGERCAVVVCILFRLKA